MLGLTGTEFSYILDRINTIIFFLFPIWPILRFLNHRYRKLILLTVALTLWIVMYWGISVVYQLSHYYGVLFASGIWMIFGWLIASLYTLLLYGIFSILFKMNINKYIAKYDVVYMLIIGVYIFFLIFLSAINP